MALGSNITNCKSFEIGEVLLINPIPKSHSLESMAVVWYDESKYDKVKNPKLIVKRMNGNRSKTQQFKTYNPESLKHNKLLEEELIKWIEVKQKGEIISRPLDIGQF